LEKVKGPPMQKMREESALVATACKFRETPAGTFEGTVMHWVTEVVVVGMGQGLAPPTNPAHRSAV
jgi:hypothetical protein